MLAISQCGPEGVPTKNDCGVRALVPDVWLLSVFICSGLSLSNGGNWCT